MYFTDSDTKPIHGLFLYICFPQQYLIRHVSLLSSSSSSSSSAPNAQCEELIYFLFLFKCDIVLKCCENIIIDIHFREKYLLIEGHSCQQHMIWLHIAQFLFAFDMCNPLICDFQLSCWWIPVMSIPRFYKVECVPCSSHTILALALIVTNLWKHLILQPTFEWFYHKLEISL